MKIAITTLALTFALTGCDQITPAAHKLVEAEANEGVNKGLMVGWLACSGKVEVTQTANGYAVKFTDRQWNDAKTAYVDVDTYLQTKRVTVRPMNAEEIGVCNTGRGLQVSLAQSPQAKDTPPRAGDDDCYDSNGNLMPNQFSAFGGSLIDCAPGHTRKPRSERAHVPAAWRVWVEQWEACDKAVVDGKHVTKEAFDACKTTAEDSRPETPAPKN
ncbi:MAG TPA: hypothetical protein VGJ33_19670 [Candidatus Angelobacter sp.]